MDANYPQSPHILSTDVGAWDEYNRLKELRRMEGMTDLQQRMNPARDTTLGEVSNISGHPIDQLATRAQYSDSPEPSSVPHYRSVPTMTNSPEVQGPYDISQPADVDSREQPIEQRYPAQGEQQTQAFPQVRQRPGNFQLPSLPGSQPEGFSKSVNTLEPEQGPPINVSRIDREAPATRMQQMLATSSLQRESQWPRNYGGGGEKTLNSKILNRTQAYMDLGWGEDDAKRQAQFEATGGTPEELGAKQENLKSRTNTSNARGRNLENDTNLDNQKFAQRQAQDRFMNDYRDRSLALRGRSEERMQGAVDSKDWATVERLNEQRYWHDETLKFLAATGKGGLHSDDEREAARQAMDIVGRMEQRPPTPDEQGFLEKLMGPRPRYKYNPRPPVQAPQHPQKGTAAPMDRGTKGANLPGHASKQSPAVVKDDADYEKLPSGTQFMGPDGKQRTKP